MAALGAGAMRLGATMRVGVTAGSTATSHDGLTPRRSAFLAARAPLAPAAKMMPVGGSNRKSFSVARTHSRLVVRADGNDDATPAVEAADPVAERAGIESGGLTDLMAQLAALQNENSKLQEDIETTKSIIESAKPPVEEVPMDENGEPIDPALVSIENFFNQPEQKPREPIGAGELLTLPDESTVKWPEPNENPPFWERPPIRMPENLDPKTCEITTMPLHVVHVTAEMAPVAKVGGLGDVVTGLARAHLCQGHNVEVCIPYYSSLEGKIEDVQHVMDFDVPKGEQWEWDGEKEIRMSDFQWSMYSGKIGGCPIIGLRPAFREGSNLFVGQKIYGGSYNEAEAYLSFCRASLECLKVTGRDPNVIHVHEWQCSAVAMLYWDVYHNQGLLNNAKIMLTIHNMDNTGECREEEFMATGVPGSEFNTLERAMDERTIGHNPERLCLMKGAIVYANYVTTVSPTYAREALSGSAGFLGKTLTKERTKFTGVINGVDTEIWDARLDNFLPANFKPGTMEGKALCKKYVQMGLGLNVDPHKPLVVCISRLVPQKGINLIEHAIPRTKEKGGQFVLLGSGHSDPPFSRLAESVYKNDKDVKLLIFYSDALSHLLYAAADCVLVPSMFEPCGLTQMIAMCYGALPIVRKTGGLADTVHDVDDPSLSDSKKNGFVFEGADNGALEGALDRALRYYHERKPWWQGMQEQVMDIDNSWERAGEEYVQLYRSITGIREEFPDHGGQ